MFEKDVKELSLLLDFYGELLSERKQSVLALYYNEDFSLAEIADEIGISRQGARDLIKKAEEELRHFEEKLGLVERFEEAKKHIASIRQLSEACNPPKELTKEIEALAELFE
ncbi:MAG: YlxM family DNA-binding protein [Clostridia bacterium]|nr:YlxM family DNA-binding protein [Clostridia bacterium]